MRFGAPEWFLCLFLVPVAAWYWRSLRQPLRMGCLVLLVMFAARPQVKRFGRGLDLWILADRSASAATSVEPHLAEWERILERSKGRDDRIFVVDYAAEAALRDPSAFSELTGSREGTQTALAARYAVSQMAAGRASRLLALTDGFSTDSLTDLPELLRRQGVALDYRLGTEGLVRDFRVEALTAPAQTKPSEPFVIEFRVTGPDGERTPFELTRDGKPLSKGTVEIKNGRGVARFTDRLAAPGGHRYGVRITPENDAHPGNNEAERWVEVVGGPSVLLVTAYQGDPLAGALRSLGLTVTVTDHLPELNEGQLAGVRAVILNNVPAFKLPGPFLHALDFYVRGQGGGLLMAGGKASFACGGYFGSPLADLLPVSMEMRQERRKLATAMAIEMDRSGSMGMPTKDGRTKIQLAGAGAARAVELLGPGDEVTVVAVDTEPHEIVPLCTVGKDAGKLSETVRRIMSAGGGINVYTALKDAYYRLRVSPAGQRHLVLLADANDALQEVGEYKEILARMRKQKITVSVIGLGTEHDSGAAFLTDVAELGGGRIYFAAEASELPGMFEQETVAVARAAFLEDPVPVKAMAGWAELAAQPLPWPAAVDGFNLSYLRPGAAAAAVTANEDAAPLVAFWQKGTGRVAAVTFPLGGDFSASVRGWASYGDFAQTLVRWLMGTVAEPGVVVRSDVEGTNLSAELLYDTSDDGWERRLAKTPPKLVIAGEKEATTLVWERMEPGRYRATATLEPGKLVRGAVQIGSIALPFGPLQASSGAEWELDPAKRMALAALARESGGVERLDLGSIWTAPRPPEYGDVGYWIPPLALLLFLIETLLTRLGWKWRTLQAVEPIHLPSFPNIRFGGPKEPKTSSLVEPLPEQKEMEADSVQDQTRRDRFRRAKNRR
ncbi:MAG: VWA domain-containing protein [Chthoniobacteraceae bacterium]